MHDFIIPVSQGYSLNIIVLGSMKIAENATNGRKGGARGVLGVVAPVRRSNGTMANSGLKLLTQLGDTP
ncbi:hypothetical protein [Massilia eurypsychrophila]|jgi:hypothetical protein|uniref:hypothetical protein n=1 Tax=Massilia eurypsychrophila TaxID=1485217 RepID=UPI001033B0EF|nr:hypothetical protein [Massilia eurypsychrophila]